jgi:Domain of unknown function (DUF427)
MEILRPWNYPESPVEELRDLIRFDWNAMDGWFEEDEEVFVHPHDPYTRIDILHSSRHVEVEVNGVKIADTHRPTLLFKTHLPTRYYIPKLDVRIDLLIPTDAVTGCAYKGFRRILVRQCWRRDDQLSCGLCFRWIISGFRESPLSLNVLKNSLV